LSVWVDERSKMRNYLELPFIIVQSPLNIQLLQNYQLNTQAETNYCFEVMQNENKMGQLFIYNRKLHSTAFSHWESKVNKIKVNQTNPSNNYWLHIAGIESFWAFQKDDQNILLFKPNTGVDIKDFNDISVLKS